MIRRNIPPDINIPATKKYIYFGNISEQNDLFYLFFSHFFSLIVKKNVKIFSVYSRYLREKNNFVFTQQLKLVGFFSFGFGSMFEKRRRRRRNLRPEKQIKKISRKQRKKSSGNFFSIFQSRPEYLKKKIQRISKLTDKMQFG